MAYERKTYDLFISDEFRSVLEEIKSDSLVAQLLLRKRHDKEELVEDPVNFISVSSQDSAKISYLTTERFGQINESEYWTSSRRFHVKPGGFISKVFKNISAKEVEVFSNLFRAESRKPKFRFEVVSGEEIRTLYHYSRHASDNGSLGVSCMRYDSCQNMMDIYVENTDKISMLVMFDEFDNVMGRSLLWHFDSNKIMDRIYTINDEQLPFYFKKWATENGYFFRSQQNWYNSLQFQNINSDRKHLRLEVKLDNYDFRRYPYLDTFKFFNPDTGTFSNYRPEGRDHYTLCSSDGSKYDWNYLEYDDLDKVYRHRGETVRLNYLNMNAHPNRCNYSEIHDQYILCEHVQWRDDIRDYIFADEYTHLNDMERIEQRIKDNEEYEKQRASRRSRRSPSTVSELLQTLNRSGDIDMTNLYNQYVEQISLDYINSINQTQPTEE